MNALTVKLEDVFVVECFGPDGRLKWRDEIHNLVVDEGLNDSLDKYFKGSAYTAAHYCGLTSGSPTITAADTLASHSGWTEVTGYDETARPTVVWGTVASGSVDNSANKAVFTINASATIGGAFIATDSTKGGTSGVLYGAGAFTGGDKTLSAGDTLNVTVTASSTAA